MNWSDINPDKDMFDIRMNPGIQIMNARIQIMNAGIQIMYL